MAERNAAKCAPDGDARSLDPLPIAAAGTLHTGDGPAALPTTLRLPLGRLMPLEQSVASRPWHGSSDPTPVSYHPYTFLLQLLSGSANCSLRLLAPVQGSASPGRQEPRADRVWFTIAERLVTDIQQHRVQPTRDESQADDRADVDLPDLVCPQCQSLDVHRSHRNLLERLVTACTASRPYRCRECQRRFWD